MRWYSQRLDFRLQSSEHPPAIPHWLDWAAGEIERTYHTFDVHQGAELDLGRVVVLAVYGSCSEDEI